MQKPAQSNKSNRDISQPLRGKILKNAVVVAGLFAMGLVMKNVLSTHQKPREEVKLNDYISSIGGKEAEWLARNIYHEARGESWDGMLAVGIVTLNRVNSPYFPDTIEDVVKEYKQFSWFWDGMVDRENDRDAWRMAKAAAAEVMLNPDLPIAREIGDATYYHADYVKPYWSDGKEHVATVGRHVFYL
ncbi:Spore cortex-lytic enzyme precursor [Prosthecochloris sp. CIB 2401]|uniref:Cell wall hydrolase n=2 Tax=Chlorobiaceae TaxID=191412 RepID=A0A5C4S121_PROVB|nr:Spore cortex-lytic enzyme precursor [Prosthecochloris sp. CIB 2401]TNJ36985.1 cell wall hydrolase [Prosthecochloris vibrioformis]